MKCPRCQEEASDSRMTILKGGKPYKVYRCKKCKANLGDYGKLRFNYMFWISESGAFMQFVPMSK